MNAPRRYVFGYGSLVAELGRGDVVRLRGHRRAWGVAMDNRVDLPGYKSYRLRHDGSRPAVFVAFLDIEPDAAAAVTGVCTQVSDRDLLELDHRERNYYRVDVTDAIEGAPGRVWAYRGSAAGRARLREGLTCAGAAVSGDYLRDVMAALQAIAPHEVGALEHARRVAGLGVLDLDRLELGVS